MNIGNLLLSLLLSLGFSGIAQANTKSMEVDSAFHLLDFVELNIQTQPFVLDQEAVTPAIVNQVQAFTGHFLSAGAQTIFKKKLARLAAKYPESLYRRISEVMIKTQVSLVDFPLVIESSNSPLDAPSAIQVGSYFSDSGQLRLTKQAFAQLNDANQAAVVLHELFGAFMEERSARILTGMFFNPAKQNDSFEQRWRVATLRAGSSAKTSKILNLAPDLMNEWLAQHIVPMTTADLDVVVKTSYIFSAMEGIIRTTEVHSKAFANWAKPEFNFTGISRELLTFGKGLTYLPNFKLWDYDTINHIFPVMECSGASLIVTGGALQCSDSLGGTIQVFNVSDSEMRKIIKVDHGTDLYSKTVFSGFILLR